MSAEAAAFVGSANPAEDQTAEDLTTDNPALDRQVEDNLALWKAVLTELEDNLDAFTGGTEVSDQARELALGWQPPSNLGPLPAELMARVRLLAKAQKVAYRQLRGESRTNRRTAELIRGSGRSAAAVYLDVAG